MEDLRYPIGRFEPKGGSTGEERFELIDQIANAPGSMREAVAGLTDEQLDTPYREGGWTVRQVVHHLADSSINGYVRFKWAATEENPTIRVYDGPDWAELADARFSSARGVVGPPRHAASTLGGLPPEPRPKRLPTARHPSRVGRMDHRRVAATLRLARTAPRGARDRTQAQGGLVALTAS